jgi:hypothetical protein
MLQGEGEDEDAGFVFKMVVLPPVISRRMV